MTFLRRHTRKIHTLTQLTKNNETVEDFIHSTLKPYNDLHKTDYSQDQICWDALPLQSHKSAKDRQNRQTKGYVGGREIMQTVMQAGGNR